MGVVALAVCCMLLGAPPVPRFRLEGRLIDTKGKALGGATVCAVLMEPHCLGEGVVELGPPVITGPDGRFKLSGADLVEFQGAVLLRVSAGNVSQLASLKVLKRGAPVHRVGQCGDGDKLEPGRVGTGDVALREAAPSGNGALDVSCDGCGFLVLTGLDPGSTTAKRLERFDRKVRLEIPAGPYLVESASGQTDVIVAPGAPTPLRL